MTDVESPRSENGPEVSLTTTGRVMSSKSQKINYFVGVCIKILYLKCASLLYKGYCALSRY